MPLANKDIVRRLYREVWNEQKLEVADQLIAPSHGLSDPTVTGASTGPEAYKQQVRRFITAFPDLCFTVEDAINEKEKLVAAWTVTGTHEGEFMGVAPTHKKIFVNGITIHQICDGKILESQTMWDALALFQQIGVSLPLKDGKVSAALR